MEKDLASLGQEVEKERMNGGKDSTDSKHPRLDDQDHRDDGQDRRDDHQDNRYDDEGNRHDDEGNRHDDQNNHHDGDRDVTSIAKERGRTVSPDGTRRRDSVLAREEVAAAALDVSRPVFPKALRQRSLGPVIGFVAALFMLSLIITLMVGSTGNRSDVLRGDLGAADLVVADVDSLGLTEGNGIGLTEGRGIGLTEGSGVGLTEGNDVGLIDAIGVEPTEAGPGTTNGAEAVSPVGTGMGEETVGTAEPAGMPGTAGSANIDVAAVPDEATALLAIVIDDWGYAWEAADDFLSFDRPLNVAVLPYLPLTTRHATEAHAAGHQVILHLPMEPLEPNWDLGPNAVTSALADDEIVREVHAAIRAIPYVTGVNNHMGSKATADPRIVQSVLQVVDEWGLFFLDSRTTAQSVVAEVAQELDVPFLVNDRFIDPDREWTRVRDRIVLAARTAKRRGYAVAIGHVRPETYRGLIEALPQLDAEGVRLAYLWEILQIQK